MPIYNGRTRISDENIWRVVDVKTTTVTSALYESLEENIQEDLQIGDFVLEITEVNQYISDDDILDNKINNINIPNGEIRKTYAVILSKENYNKLQYLTGFTTNTSYSTLGSLRNDINNLKANIVYLIRNNDKYDEYILAGSGNNKELVKIGDTSVTFDSSNLVDVSEFLQLRTDLKQSHDELNNRISSNATNISKNTNNIQNLTNETLSIKNNLNDVEANVTTLKKEVWGSNTTTGDSRIDILEETTQKKERTEIDYLDMGTTTEPGYYNVVNQNGNGFSITYKTSENGASSTIENITKAPMDVYSTILNGVSYVMQRIIIGDKTYTRYLNVSSNATGPWMAEPVVTNTVTNTPDKIPTSQAVVNYVPNPSSTTPSADTTSGSVGTDTTWARSNHTHPKSSLYAEANHTHGNITNDGKIVGTSNNSNKNVVTDASGKITIATKPTIPIASTSIPSADTTNGDVGTGTAWARSDHAHPKSSLYAEASHTHSQYLTSHQDITGKEDKSNKVISWNNTPSNDNYPSEKLVKDSLDSKASTDSVNNLGSALNSNLNTIYSFINHVTTDKVYDKGNLTNIGTTPDSTQELVNSKIDSQLGTIDSQLGTIDSQLGTIDSQLGNNSFFIVNNIDLSGKRRTYQIDLTFDQFQELDSCYIKVPTYETSTKYDTFLKFKDNNEVPFIENSAHLRENGANGYLLKVQYDSNQGIIVLDKLLIDEDKFIPSFFDLSTVAVTEASLNGGLQNIGAFTIHTVYNVNGSTSAYDISSGLLYAQQSPVFFLVKNTIGDNEANATLKYYPNGNNITIMDTSSNTSNSPIQQGAWKKNTWALFFCQGNSIVQLRCIFYDGVDINKIKNILGMEDLTYYVVSSVSKTSKRVTLNVHDTGIYNGNNFYLKVPYYETSTNVSVCIDGSSGKVYQNSTAVTESQVNGYLLKLKWNNNSNSFDVLDIYEDDRLVPYFSDLSSVATSGSYNDLSDKPTIVDNLDSTSSTSVLSAKQGKVLNDLIGDAITYINGTGGN